MHSALPIVWDSVLEDPSSQSPTYSNSEESIVAHHDITLQYVASSLQEQDLFASDEQLPILDEALFDISEVPDLEEVDFIPSSMANDFAVDIPPLEDEWLDQHLLNEFSINSQDPPKTTEQFLFKEPIPVPETTHTSEIHQNSPALIDVGDLSIANEEIIISTPTYVESCGSESPMSCYSDESFVDKKRRISQISVSSYCSSAGESLWSPSTSDSEHESKRVGRKSKFTIEDRKERKKAQNRTAAERYRQKRKQQEETITEEEQVLIDGNTELKTEVTKLQAEVSCLKQLLRDMLQAKGVSIPAPKRKKISN